MRAATAVLTLLAVVLVLTAPSRAAAQVGNPNTGGGGAAGQMLPGNEAAVAMASSPLQSLLSLLTYPSIALQVSGWMSAPATAAPTRAYASGRSARSGMQRRAAYGRTSR